jgi:hypothetical protein
MIVWGLYMMNFGKTLTITFVAAALVCFHCSRLLFESSRTTRRPMKMSTAVEAEDVSTTVRCRPSEKRTVTTTVQNTVLR